MLKEAEVEADLKNASDLFAGIKVEDNADDDDIDELLGGEDDEEEEVKREEKAKITEETPLTIHPLFRVKDKTGYEKLHKALGNEMKRLDEENHLAYVSSLAIDLISTMCEPLNAEQTRKVISTLNAQVTKKLKDERKARLSKTGGTSLGGAGKKKAKGNNLNLGGRDAIGDMLEDEQDYGDDDFM
ncbi:DEKNAAC105199 [Brettanomyces naardenensis]|uniref:Eukaryotic translation initiation factor 3 30 kDa subunit n=1 Tax=Brettanomyces naardenensis TaxID=13370 RepID=A0A448YSS9_BRENA|nr:DEKNAAC105199 [Brettanomyces naardenensis]